MGSFTYLSDILHVVSQALLAPDIILLLAFIGYALFSIGSVIAEYFTERRHFQVTMPKFLAALMAADEDAIPDVIKGSGLLKRQKVALYTVYEYRALPGDALVALVRRLVNEEETRYDRITGRNNMAAKVAPMLGLMGTHPGARDGRHRCAFKLAARRVRHDGCRSRDSGGLPYHRQNPQQLV